MSAGSCSPVVGDAMVCFSMSAETWHATPWSSSPNAEVSVLQEWPPSTLSAVSTFPPEEAECRLKLRNTPGRTSVIALSWRSIVAGIGVPRCHVSPPSSVYTVVHEIPAGSIM